MRAEVPGGGIARQNLIVHVTFPSLPISELGVCGSRLLLIRFLTPLFLRVSEISCSAHVPHVESLCEVIFSPDVFMYFCLYPISLQRSKDLTPLGPDHSLESLLL